MTFKRVTVAAAVLAAVLAAIGWGQSSAASSPVAANPLSLARAHHERYRAQVSARWPAGSYTYLSLRRADAAEAMVVVVGDAPAAGEVEVEVFARAEPFTSKRLHRTFSSVSFGTVNAVPTPRSN